MKAKRIAKVGYVVLTVASLVVTVPLWYRVMFTEPIVAVEGEKQPPPAVMVDYGDTLWAIAKRVAPRRGAWIETKKIARVE